VKPTDMDKYQLWWDYLILSDEYKKYCGDRESTKTAPTLMSDFDPDPLERNYLSFGNVHIRSFDDFWANRSMVGGYIFLKRSWDHFVNGPLVEFKDYFKERVIDYLEKPHIYFDGPNESGMFMPYEVPKKKPSYEDLKKRSLSLLADNTHRHITIDLSCPIADIKKEFNKIVNRKTAIRPSKNREYLECRFQKPTPNLRFDEVKYYYNVLEVIKIDKKSGKVAFEKIHPNGDYSNGDERSQFYSANRKAKRILKNVEQGYFPGKY